MFTTTAIDATGRVLQVTQSQAESLAGVREDAQLILSEPPPFEDSYWDFDSYTWARMGEQPTPHHTFNWTTKQWEDLRTLQDLKLLRRAYVDAQRLAANESTFTFRGKLIQADRVSRGDIDGINGQVNNTGFFPSGWPGAWKCLDNTWEPIANVAEWRDLYTAMVNQGTANFGYAQMLKGQIDAAITPEQVEAIVW